MNIRMLIALVLAIMIFGGTALFAGPNEEEYEMNVTATMPSSGYFGVMIADFNSDKAEELEYPYGIGCILESVVAGSPAEEAGLRADDIIMGVDDKEVMNKDGFLAIANELEPGQVVYLSVWREGESLSLPVTLGTRDQGDMNVKIEKQLRFNRGKSVGYGGGGWMPQWFSTDLTDINDLMIDLGFRKLDDNGFLMQGGVGKGNVGKGFFLGGQGVSYTIEKKVVNPTDPTYHTWLRYSNSMGGITVDKRFPLFGKLVGSLGVMLGVGEHMVEITNTNGDYEWSDLTGDDNSNIKLTRSYAVIQPRMELIYPLLSWFSIRAEAGYTYGYNGGEGWKLQAGNSEMYDVANSPSTKFQGLNVSIGPWFGF